jgi:hypothetical protein
MAYHPPCIFRKGEVDKRGLSPLTLTLSLKEREESA